MQKLATLIAAESKRAKGYMDEIKSKLSSSKAIAAEIKAKYSNCNSIECFKQL